MRYNENRAFEIEYGLSTGTANQVVIENFNQITHICRIMFEEYPGLLSPVLSRLQTILTAGGASVALSLDSNKRIHIFIQKYEHAISQFLSSTDVPVGGRFTKCFGSALPVASFTEDLFELIRELF